MKTMDSDGLDTLLASFDIDYFYLRRFSESRSSSGSTPSVCSFVCSFFRLFVRNTFWVPSLCNL